MPLLKTTLVKPHDHIRETHIISGFRHSYHGITNVVLSTMVLLGKWKRPEAFPEEAYNSLIWPDMIFIPLYFLTAILLYKGKKAGELLGVFSGGAVTYVMVYLFALSGLHGTVNMIFDGAFFGLNIGATLQIISRLI